MWSAATFHRRDRHHDASIVSRTWSGSTASAVRKRSGVLASRSPPVRKRFLVLVGRSLPERSGGGDTPGGMAPPCFPIPLSQGGPGRGGGFEGWGGPSN